MCSNIQLPFSMIILNIYLLLIQFFRKTFVASKTHNYPQQSLPASSTHTIICYLEICQCCFFNSRSFLLLSQSDASFFSDLSTTNQYFVLCHWHLAGIARSDARALATSKEYAYPTILRDSDETLVNFYFSVAFANQKNGHKMDRFTNHKNSGVVLSLVNMLGSANRHLRSHPDASDNMLIYSWVYSRGSLLSFTKSPTLLYLQNYQCSRRVLSKFLLY